MSKQVTWVEFSALFVSSQETTEKRFAADLRRMKERYDSEGFFIARCEVMDSSLFGNRVALGFGKSHTWKSVPDHPISIRGLASDTSVVECWIPASEVPNA